MEPDSISSRICLFCGTQTTSLIPNGIVVKEEECDPAAFSIFADSGGLDRLVSDQLKSVFIVRKLLDIPVEKCIQYLQHNGGRENPDSWFVVCRNCIKSVEESYQIYLDLQLLRSKLENIKENLSSLIITQHMENNSERRKCKEKKNEKDFVYFDICNYVTDSISGPVIFRESTVPESQVKVFCVPTKKQTTVPNSKNKTFRITTKKQSAVSDPRDNKAFHIIMKKGKGDCIWCKKNDRKRRQTQIKCKVCNVRLCLQKGDTSCFSKFHDDMKKGHIGSNQQAIGQHMNIDNSRDLSGIRQPISTSIHQPQNSTGRVLFDIESPQLYKTNQIDHIPPITYSERLRSSTHKFCTPHVPSPIPEEQNTLDSSECLVGSPCQNSDGDGDDVNDTDWNPEPITTSEVEMEQTNECKMNSNISSPNFRKVKSKGGRLKASTRRQIKIIYKNSCRAATSPEDTGDKNSTFLPESIHEESKTTKLKNLVRTTYVNRCELCVAYYKRSEDFTKHMKLHSNDEGVPCPNCGWLCSKKVLKYHIRRRHGNGKRSRKDKLKRKVRVTKYDYKIEDCIPHYCDFCHMIYTSKKFLLRHMDKYHSSDHLPCSVCDSTFETKQRLEMHYKEQHPLENMQNGESQEGQPQTCEFCPESFQSKLKRDYHIAKVHRNTLLICKICGHKSGKFHLFLDHKRRHAREKYMCELCSRHFSSYSYFKSHMNNVHYTEVGTEPIKCTECDITFHLKSALRDHMDHVHLKLKELFCEHCGKAFAWPCDLKRHILLHTAPREQQYKQGPFFCEFCQAKYNVRQGLYYHMKNKHSDKYSFKCAYCGTGYTTQNTLTQHERKCQGKLPSGSKTVNVE